MALMENQMKKGEDDMKTDALQDLGLPKPEVPFWRLPVLNFILCHITVTPYLWKLSYCNMHQYWVLPPRQVSL